MHPEEITDSASLALQITKQIILAPWGNHWSLQRPFSIIPSRSLLSSLHTIPFPGNITGSNWRTWVSFLNFEPLKGRDSKIHLIFENLCSTYNCIQLYTTLYTRCSSCCLVAKSCPTLCDPMDCSFPRQEFCSGFPFPPLGDLLDPGIKPMSPELAGRFFTADPSGKLCAW